MTITQVNPTLTDADFEDPLVGDLLRRFQKLTAEIAEIDSELNVDAAGRAKVLDAATNGVQEEADRITEQLKTIFDSHVGADLVGLVHSVNKLLKTHSDTVKAYVDENVVKVDKPSDARLAELVENRKKPVAMVQQIRALVENMDEEIAAKLPKVEQRRGAVGSRGQTGERLSGSYNFTVGGTEIKGTTLSAVLQALKSAKVEGVNSVVDLKTAMVEQNEGFEIKNPPASFSFKVKDVEVVATRQADSDPEDADDNDVDDNSSILSEDDDEI